MAVIFKVKDVILLLLLLMILINHLLGMIYSYLGKIKVLILFYLLYYL